MTLRPSQLPKVRRQTVRFLNDSQSAIRSKTSPENGPALDVLTAALETGELFWVQQDMAALAMHAGEQLAAASWTAADRPSVCGLLYWDGGIGHIDYPPVQIPVEACAWSPHEGGLMLWLLMSRDRLVAATANASFTLVTEEIPPLIPIYGSVLPIGEEPTSLADLESRLPQPVVAALASAWLLMQQPTLVDRTRERADKSTARAYARESLPAPEVTIVDLRRQYAPKDREQDEGVSSRQYRHRWVVSGHWRNQAYGPERSLRRRTWVPSYVKGPDGAPLLVTEKVNVWRR